jgi:hypothetical protein
MKLFNKTIDRQLFKQYSLGSDLSKQEVVVKIFNPQGGQSWFIINSDPEDPDYLWAIVDLGYGAEVGSVSRSELENYRGRFGLGFERDLSFDPVNAEELLKGLRRGEFYADGGNINGMSDNQRMIMNQNVEIEHHHEELEDILEDKVDVPAWVVSKMATANENLSDVTHFLDGQKELLEDEKEDDEDEVKNKEVVEPIDVSVGTKTELTKNFTQEALGNLKGFLKGMNGIDLTDLYTFEYNNQEFEIEPIINSDENGVSNAVFTIFNSNGEEVGEITYSREGGKQKFTANSEFFSWNNTKFENGGFMNDVYADGGEFNNGFDLKDINGKKIEVGDIVKTTQPSGGLFNPANPEIGIVEKTKDAYGNNALQIKYRKQGTNYDRFILLNGKINEILEKTGSFAKGRSLEDRLTKLEKKKSDLESKLFNARLESNRKFNNLGFGAGMRRSKISISTTREDSLRERIEVVEKDIEQIKKEMSWNNHKYILKADIETVTLKRNGKEVTYKGSDVYNGANIFSKGGDLQSKANYIPKRDVVSVQLKNGETVKPVNGYWVKKGAEPISPKKVFTYKDLPKDGSEIKITAPAMSGQPAIDLILRYDSKNFRFDVYQNNIKRDVIGEKEVLNNLNSGIYVFSNQSTATNLQPEISETEIRKDSRGNWRAETTVDNFNGYDWRISTVKTYSGNLVSSAQGGKTEPTGSKGYSIFKYTMYEDPHHTLEVSKPKRLTDKVVSEQHDKALAKFKKFMETGMFKGGGKISNFDKLSAKVAKEYEGKPVKGKYQEEYGKYYSHEEAQEVGDKVAGKIKGMQLDKKAFGGLFGGVKEKVASKKYPNLDDKMVFTKDGRAVSVFDQVGGTLYVLDANKIGTGERPYRMDISEIDPNSYEMGGVTFDEKSKAIAKNFVGKKVEPKYQKEYGKTYDKKEAKEVGNKIAGSMVQNQSREKLKKATALAKEIRKDGEKWNVALKRAFTQLKD